MVILFYYYGTKSLEFGQQSNIPPKRLEESSYS